MDDGWLANLCRTPPNLRRVTPNEPTKNPRIISNILTNVLHPVVELRRLPLSPQREILASQVCNLLPKLQKATSNKCTTNPWTFCGTQKFYFSSLFSSPADMLLARNCPQRQPYSKRTTPLESPKERNRRAPRKLAMRQKFQIFSEISDEPLLALKTQHGQLQTTSKFSRQLVLRR